MKDQKIKKNVINVCLKEGNKIGNFAKSLDLDLAPSSYNLMMNPAPQIEQFKAQNYSGKRAPKQEKIMKELYESLPPEQRVMFRIYQIELPEGTDVEALKAQLDKDDRIEFAEFDYLNDLYLTPNDPRFNELYGMQKIDAECAWDLTQGDGVVVAVVDTGVDYNHPDLKDNMWRGPGGIVGHDFSDNDTNPADYHGHGTHVAGTIAAVGHNNEGVIGVAPNAEIMAIKIFPNAFDSVIVEALAWAVDNGAKVLNNSWGPNSRRPSAPVLEAAIDYVYSKGGICIFAAGNSNDGTAFYSPANYEKTISVAATDSNDQRASFSNFGPTTDVAAPGVGILSCRRNGGYTSLNGTSMAAPHVAGLAALILANDPGLTFEAVRDCIKDSADIISTDQPIGVGRINACSALRVKNNCIAFSASGENHISEGANLALTYGSTQLNEGTAWDGTNFIAPANGLYHFALSFVKDALHFQGTRDDVRIFVNHNGTQVGKAWSMEGAGWSDTASYAVALKLNKGDQIYTEVNSDSGRKRVLPYYTFTGHMICAI